MTFGSYCNLKGMLFRWGLFRKVFPTDVPPNYTKKKGVRKWEKKPVASTGPSIKSLPTISHNFVLWSQEKIIFVIVSDFTSIFVNPLALFILGVLFQLLPLLPFVVVLFLINSCLTHKESGKSIIQHKKRFKVRDVHKQKSDHRLQQLSTGRTDEFVGRLWSACGFCRSNMVPALVWHWSVGSARVTDMSVSYLRDLTPCNLVHM